MPKKTKSDEKDPGGLPPSWNISNDLRHAENNSINSTIINSKKVEVNYNFNFTFYGTPKPKVTERGILQAVRRFLKNLPLLVARFHGISKPKQGIALLMLVAVPSGLTPYDPQHVAPAHRGIAGRRAGHSDAKLHRKKKTFSDRNKIDSRIRACGSENHQQTD